MPDPSLFADAPWTPTQLARAARRSVEANIGPLWVRGEISGFKAYQSGHWYFSIGDGQTQIRCVMWKAQTLRIRSKPNDGAQVFLYGTPTVWEEKGEFRLTVTEVLLTGDTGDQQLALERIRAALMRDGLTDPARKRPLPPLPTGIAVVTSLDGAALRDIMTVTRKRFPAMRLVVVGTRVQGTEAEAELVRALGVVNRLAGVDVCILARGGGSREDLAVFNSEAVCRALAAVTIPTISAIGHETDMSLTDLVADFRAATPSAAAEIAVPDASALGRQVATLAVRLGQALDRGTRLGRERLARTADRLEHLLTQRLERPRLDLLRLGAQLDALSPLKVLERGYAVPTGADGRILRRRAEFSSGLPFTLRVTDGQLAARVEGDA